MLLILQKTSLLTGLLTGEEGLKLTYKKRNAERESEIGKLMPSNIKCFIIYYNWQGCWRVKHSHA